MCQPGYVHFSTVHSGVVFHFQNLDRRPSGRAERSFTIWLLGMNDAGPHCALASGLRKLAGHWERLERRHRRADSLGSLHRPLASCLESKT